MRLIDPRCIQVGAWVATGRNGEAATLQRQLQLVTVGCSARGSRNVMTIGAARRLDFARNPWRYRGVRLTLRRRDHALST